MKRRVRLIHFDAAEAAPLIAAMSAAGYHVDYEESRDHPVWHDIRDQQPVAVVIDLSRLPSHGREIGIFLRGKKSTRQIPILYVNGAPEKVEAIRENLPDAVYTTTPKIAGALKKAVAKPPANPVTPAQMMDRYQARSAAQKLGIKPGGKIALIDPPRDYPAVIGSLPEGASFLEEARGRAEVTLWFVHDPAVFQQNLPRMRARAADSRFWILWRKGTRQGLTQPMIREQATSVGLVDYKICSVNPTWSGLLFALKKT